MQWPRSTRSHGPSPPPTVPGCATTSCCWQRVPNRDASSVPGADLEGVRDLRNVETSERLKIEFAQARRVVIIGAGWIGLETAAAARAAETGSHAPRVW